MITPAQLNAAYDAYHSHANEQTLNNLFSATRQYAERIASYYYRHDAEELAQQITVHAWTHLRQYSGQSSFSTWLYRLAHNYLRDHLRRTKNDRLTLGEDALVYATAAEMHLPRDASRLRTLTPGQQAVVDAIARTGSYADTCDELGLTAAQLKVRVARIKKKLAA